MRLSAVEEAREEFMDREEANNLLRRLLDQALKAKGFDLTPETLNPVEIAIVLDEAADMILGCAESIAEAQRAESRSGDPDMERDPHEVGGIGA